MNAFERAQTPDTTRITVRIWKGERGSIYGEVIPPDESGHVDIPFSASGPKSPAEALAVAIVLSRRFNCAIVVVDDENLWNPEWGALS